MVSSFLGFDLFGDLVDGLFNTVLPSLQKGIDSFLSFLGILNDLSVHFPAFLVGALVTAFGIRLIMNFF